MNKILKLPLSALLALCCYPIEAAQVSGKIVDMITWQDEHTVLS